MAFFYFKLKMLDYIKVNLSLSLARINIRTLDVFSKYFIKLTLLDCIKSSTSVLN